MHDNPVISARLLTKAYGRRPVLDQLDITIMKGSAVGLLGANGAGKTTLLKALLGLGTIDGGRCEIVGEQSQNLSPEARARIGYVPQVSGQFSWLTGQAMLRYISTFCPNFDWEYARDLSDRWKLALRSPIATLSPGLQQRLSIVRALCSRPDVLVLDEPIASLDPATRIAVIDELIAERSRRGMTVVFSSHLIGDLERLCTHFAILATGKIALFETLEWFRQLTRVRIAGDEQVLAQLPTRSFTVVRKVREGERAAVVPSTDLERLSATLSSELRLTAHASDVETIASEWMQ